MCFLLLLFLKVWLSLLPSKHAYIFFFCSITLGFGGKRVNKRGCHHQEIKGSDVTGAGFSTRSLSCNLYRNRHDEIHAAWFRSILAAVVKITQHFWHSCHLQCETSTGRIKLSAFPLDLHNVSVSLQPVIFIRRL